MRQARSSDHSPSKMMCPWLIAVRIVPTTALVRMLRRSIRRLRTAQRQQSSRGSRRTCIRKRRRAGCRQVGPSLARCIMTATLSP